MYYIIKYICVSYINALNVFYYQRRLMDLRFMVDIYNLVVIKSDTIQENQ